MDTCTTPDVARAMRAATHQLSHSWPARALSLLQLVLSVAFLAALAGGLALLLSGPKSCAAAAEEVTLTGAAFELGSGVSPLEQAGAAFVNALCEWFATA